MIFHALARVTLSAIALATACALLPSAAEAYHIGVVRNSSNGSFDTSFSNSGGRYIDLPGDTQTQNVYAVLPQGDKLVIAGSAAGNDGVVRFMLARLNANGTVDTTFGAGGVSLTRFGSAQNSVVESVALDPNGKIVAAGHSDGWLAVARYNSNGTLDTGFSGDGGLIARFGTIATFGNAVTVQSNGKITVAGEAFDGTAYYAVMRFNSNGSFDTTFSGDGGILASPCGGRGHDMAIDSSNRVIVVGNCSGNGKIGVVRLTSTGALDTTFSGDGLNSFGFAGVSVLSAEGVTVDSSNRVWIAGSADDKLLIARVAANGNPDTNFGGDGAYVTNLTGEDAEGFEEIAISGSKILAVGSSSNNNSYTRFLTARFNSDGTLDTSFSSNGLSSSISWKATRTWRTESRSIRAAGS
jgi:uncharacterized delta-60 repeat protein